MFGLSKGRLKTSLGLDINPERVVFTLIKPNKAKNATQPFKLEKCIVKQLPSGLLSSGNVYNAQALGEILKGCIEDNNLADHTLNIAIPGNLPFIKTLTVLDVPPEELKIIVPQEAEKFLPFPFSDVNMDYIVLEPTKRIEENTNKVDILLIAVLKSIVKSYIEATTISNCYVKSVDITPFTLFRVMQANRINGSEYVIGVLIGYDNTDIILIHHGVPVFIHAVPIGKKDLLDAISSSLGMSNDQVVELLPEIELLVAGGSEVSRDPKLVKAGSAARSPYNNIANEIQKAVEFFCSQKGSLVEISKVYIAGVGVCIGNIDTFISNRVKSPVELINPLSHIDTTGVEGLASPSEITSSLGLSLKGLV